VGHLSKAFRFVDYLECELAAGHSLDAFMHDCEVPVADRLAHFVTFADLLRVFPVVGNDGAHAALQ